jgi:hypothetical protein
MTGVKKGKKPKGNHKGRRKTLQMNNSKERLCLVSALIRAVFRHAGPLEKPNLEISVKEASYFL